MEILFVSHKFPPSMGGMEKQSFELIQGMRKFAKVHAIVYEGVGGRIKFFLQVKKKIRKMLEVHSNISIIHYNDGTMAVWCGRFKKYPNIKYAVTFHGLDLVFPLFVYQKWILPSFNRFDLIITVSQATAWAAIQRRLVPEKILVINNGVDHEIGPIDGTQEELRMLFQPHGVDVRHRKVLLAFGRPVKRKGFSWFVRNVLHHLPPHVVFVMAGPFHREATFVEKVLSILPAPVKESIELFFGLSSDEREIRNLLAHPEYKNRVVHLGKLPFKEIQRLLSIAEAFVMPNIPVKGDMEGFGLVCLEAAMCNATVFASHMQGLPQAVHHGYNGYLIPPNDPMAWAEALNEYFRWDLVNGVRVDNPRLYTMMHFSWDKMVRQYADAFRRLLSGKETSLPELGAPHPRIA